MEFSLVDETDILTQGDEKGSVQLLQAAIPSLPQVWKSGRTSWRRQHLSCCIFKKQRGLRCRRVVWLVEVREEESSVLKAPWVREKRETSHVNGWSRSAKEQRLLHSDYSDQSRGCN